MLCKFEHIEKCLKSQPPIKLIKSLTINEDFSWSVHVHGYRLNATKCSALGHVPEKINTKATLNKLLLTLDTLNVCSGNPDAHFLALADSRNGVFQSQSNSTIAFVDAFNSVSHNGKVFDRTVRTSECELLVIDTSCNNCKQYRCTLRSLYSKSICQSKSERDKHTAVSSHTNYRYLKGPQHKERMSKLKAELNSKRKEVERLKAYVKEVNEKHGISIDTEIEQDLENIMKEHSSIVEKQYSKDSFHYLFWNEQLKHLKLKNKRQIRWHPMMIRWCLSLKLLSSASYNALRSSNLLILPSERTLRDYTHTFKSKPGFQVEIDQMLCEVAKIDTIPEFQRYVCLSCDEVKVKEDLIYDKHSLKLIGFVQLDDVNDHITKFADRKDSNPVPKLATHILSFMVKRLDASGFKVIAITCDGASHNRTFMKLHNSNDVIHKTINPFCDETRPVFFISDPPHLIKTVRNCWANSYSHAFTRQLKVTSFISFLF